MAVITFPKILTDRLTDRLTDEGARALADMFNTVENSAQKATLEIAEERFEKRVAQVQSALETKIAQSEARLETKIAQSEARLETKIAQSEARLIKWMFIFIFGQFWLIIGTITGILFAFFKH